MDDARVASVVESAEEEPIDLEVDSENLEEAKDFLELSMTIVFELYVAVALVAEVSLTSMWKKFLGLPQQRPFSSPSQQ